MKEVSASEVMPLLGAEHAHDLEKEANSSYEEHCHLWMCC